MSMFSSIYAQFRKPTGVLGGLAGWIMSHRSSNQLRNHWTVDQLYLSKTDQVLEIGFGPGLGLQICGETITDGKITGIDHSDTMYSMACERNRPLIESGTLECRICDIESQPLKNQKFDKIFSINVAQFWQDRWTCLKYLYEHLEDGGTLATTYQPRHRGATNVDSITFGKELSQQLDDIGFKKIITKQLELNPIVVCVIAIK